MNRKASLLLAAPRQGSITQERTPMAPQIFISDVNAFGFEEFAHVIGACRQSKLIAELRIGLDKLSDGLNGLVHRGGVIRICFKGCSGLCRLIVLLIGNHDKHISLAMSQAIQRVGEGAE
jgi:hypothetical protein